MLGRRALLRTGLAVAGGCCLPSTVFGSVAGHDLACSVETPVTTDGWSALVGRSVAEGLRVTGADGTALNLEQAMRLSPIGLRSVASKLLAWKPSDGLRGKNGKPAKDRIRLGVAFFDSVPKGKHDRILELATEWTAGLPFSFEQADLATAQVRINHSTAYGSSNAPVGRSGRDIAATDPTMRLKDLSDFTIRHEFGHVMGLFHEQRSPDSGFEWDEDAILKDYIGNTWGGCDKGEDVCRAAIRRNITTAESDVNAAASAFDPKSIMAYPVKECWLKLPDGRKCKPGKHVLAANQAISPQDLLAVQVMYGAA